MTTRAPEVETPTAGAPVETAVIDEPRQTLAGTGALLRFMLRRERLALPLWLIGAGFLFAYQSAGSQTIYDSDEKLAQFRETIGGNAAMIAMSGPDELVQTIGGEVTFEVFAFICILVGLMNMFLVGRHTRSDEETGRAELIRSTRVGRHATLAAALGLALLANLGAGLLVFAGGAATGLPVTGSILVGLALAAVGLTFAGVAAVAVQLYEHARGVYGAVTLVIGASMVLRGAGDVSDNGLSWASPIGWGQQTLPYVENRWWPLLIPVAAAAVLTAVAVALLDRRDVGAGLVASRPGRATASRALSSPLGLAWRLHRGWLYGWTIGLFALGAAYGSIGDSIEQYIEDNPEVAEVLTGGAGDVLDAYLSVTLLMSVMISTAYGIVVLLRVRGEESSLRAEPILATPVSRWSYLASHLAVALVGNAVVVAAAGFGSGLAFGLTVDDTSQILRLTGYALTYVAAVWTVLAVTTLAIGVLPRMAPAISWAVFGYLFFMGFLGQALDVPDVLVDVSPFEQTPRVPLDDLTATPLLVITAVAAALMVAGFAGFRRRDILN